MATKQQKIELLLKQLEAEQETVYREDFVAAFEDVVKFVGSVQKELNDRNEKINKDLVNMFGKLSSETKDTTRVSTEKLKKEIKAVMDQHERKMQGMMNMIYDKISVLRDGKDADEEAMMGKLMAAIPEIPEFKIPQEIPQALEDIKKEHEQLRKELEEVRTARRFAGGTGAVTDGHVKFSIGRLVKKETPSGAINGVNTSYTVSQQIHAVLSFAINGQAITDDEYTVAGNTITMDSAIDASLSGTSFRVTYV